jgi:phage antirepressor YoqD-like protein
METLSILNSQDNDKTMSSREIAELTGKRHDHVLVDCDKLNISYRNLTLPEISGGVYTLQSTGKQQHREYHLTRMQTFDLMTGYNVELRIKVNRRWEELESKAKLDFTNPNVVLQLAQNWAEEQNKRIAAEKQVKMLTPKAELMDKVLDTDTKIDIGQAAKILGLSFGRNSLFEKLREKGVFFKNKNEPKQEYIDRGYFQLKEKFIERTNHPGFVVIKVLVTQRGLEFIANTFNAVHVPKRLANIE